MDFHDVPFDRGYQNSVFRYNNVADDIAEQFELESVELNSLLDVLEAEIVKKDLAGLGTDDNALRIGCDTDDLVGSAF